jgi:hypothetical protein
VPLHRDQFVPGPVHPTVEQVTTVGEGVEVEKPAE